MLMNQLLRRTVLVCALAVCLSTAHAQDRIAWSAERPLTWDDFTGSVPPGTPRDAYTYYGIEATWARDEQGAVSFTVECFFLPARSWVKRDARESTALLAHEQLHFDIAALHTAELSGRMARLKPDGEVERRFNNLQEAVMAEAREEQQRYDRETDHGRDEEAQERWRRAVHGRLVKAGLRLE